MSLFVRLAFLAALVSCTLAGATADDTLKALIIDGQNNHTAWPKTTVMMKRYLEETGRFTVDISRTRYTWKGGLMKDFPLGDGKEYEDLKASKTDPDFKPDFAAYDVVINNFGWNAAPWPESTQTAFDDYMKGGGGLVIVHAANNSFGEWSEYNQMIGLGGWGGRTEKSGPYVYVNDAGETIRDETPGKGGAHGPQHNYQIVTRSPDHPIMQGLPRVWLHTRDELYERLRGPANHMTILATAYADEQYKGSGRNEPMIMTIDYGKGRVFHTAMGHADYSVQCVGFITTLLRGTEWAASGRVTLTDVPDDFPTADKTSDRPFE